MNKFAIVVLAALAATQLVAGAPSTSEQSEVSKLTGDQQLFKGFCKSSRNFVLGEVKKNSADSSAFILEKFFGEAQTVAKKVLDVQRQAVAELGPQLRNPDAKFSRIAEDVSEVEIVKGKDAINKAGSGLAGFVPGVKAVATSMFNAANRALKSRADMYREWFANQKLVLNGLLSTCDMVDGFASQLEEQFDQEKQSLAQSAQVEEVRQFIETATMNKIPCQTSNNILFMKNMCRIFRDGRHHLMKALGLDGTKYAEALVEDQPAEVSEA